MKWVTSYFKVDEIELSDRYWLIFGFNDLLCFNGTSFESITLIKNGIFFELKRDYFRHLIIGNQTYQHFILRWWNFTPFFFADFIPFRETVFLYVINSLEFFLRSIRFIQTNRAFVKKRLNFTLHNDCFVENTDDFTRKYPLRKLHLVQLIDHNRKLIKRQHPHLLIPLLYTLCHELFLNQMLRPNQLQTLQIITYPNAHSSQLLHTTDELCFFIKWQHLRDFLLEGLLCYLRVSKK